MVLLLLLGMVFLHLVEGWELLDSAYVLTQVITTVGYGDYTPSTSAAKLFMCFYAILILVAVSYFLNTRLRAGLDKSSDFIIDHLNRAEARVEGVDVRSLREARKLALLNQAFTGFLFFAVPVVVGAIAFRFLQGCTCDHDRASRFCVDDTNSECVDTGGYTPSWLDSFYMSVITLCTIGFGDFTPATHNAKLFSIIWMVVGVASTALFIDTLTHAFFEDESRDRLIMAEELLNMDRKTFDLVDRDRNGYLTRGEFLSYSLIKYGGVQPALIDKVLEAFDAMEKSGDDRVTWDEVVGRQEKRAAALTRGGTGTLSVGSSDARGAA